jgi:hypothetical protein
MDMRQSNYAENLYVFFIDPMAVFGAGIFLLVIDGKEAVDDADSFPSNESC